MDPSSVSNPKVSDLPGREQRLVQKLYDNRARYSSAKKIDELGALFLDNPFERFEKRWRLPDKDLIEDILSKAAATEDQEKRLSRIWVVMRELMAIPYDDENRYLEYLPLRNQALGRWANAAAWYGLHAHLNMGCLAALSSMARCREVIRRHMPKVPLPHSVEHPGGPLGSAYYSIAKLMPDRKRRQELLNLALGHLEIALANKQGDTSGLLAIRGSVNLRLGSLGRAVEDYETVLRFREQKGENPGRIGEALSELGFGYLYQGKFLRGREYLEKGVNLLASSGHSGFLVRAKRKLALSYMLTGHPLKAQQEWTEATQIAKTEKIFDQIK